MKFSVEHWGIMAEDPPGLARWYQDVLGFDHLFVPPGQEAPVFVRDEAGVILEFFPLHPDIRRPSAPDRKIQHLSLKVNDFEEAVGFLREKGVEFREETIELFMGARAIFFQDPEGNWIHLIHRPVMPW